MQVAPHSWSRIPRPPARCGRTCATPAGRSSTSSTASRCSSPSSTTCSSGGRWCPTSGRRPSSRRTIRACRSSRPTGDVLSQGVVHGGSASAPSLLEVQAAYDETMSRPRGRDPRARPAPLRPGRGAHPAGGRCRAARRPPSPDCTSPTPAWRPSPSSSASSGRSPGPPSPRPTGSPRRSAAAETALAADREQLDRPPGTARTPRRAARPRAGRRQPRAPRRDRVRGPTARGGRPTVPAHRGGAASRRWPPAPSSSSAPRRTSARPVLPPASDGCAGRASSSSPRRSSHGARITLSRIESSVARRRARAHRGRAGHDASATPTCPPVRAALRELGAEADRLKDSVHRDEVARAEQRMRIEQVRGQGARGLRHRGRRPRRRVRTRPARARRRRRRPAMTCRPRSRSRTRSCAPSRRSG